MGGGLLLADRTARRIGGRRSVRPRRSVDVVWLRPSSSAALQRSTLRWRCSAAADRDHDSHLPAPWLVGLVSLALVPSSMLALDSIRRGHLGMLAAIAVSVAARRPRRSAAG